MADIFKKNGILHIGVGTGGTQFASDVPATCNYY